MKKKQWKDEVLGVKLSRLTHEALLILQKHYGKKSMGDALLAYLEEKDPDLMKRATEAVALREKLENIHDAGLTDTEDDS